MAAWDTADEIILQAAVEVGLTPTPTPFTSVDSNYVQMRYLLNSGGKELSRRRAWTHLRKEHTFTTVQGTSVYQYPDGFLSMIGQTGWNRTNRLPLGGPLSPQEWQYLKSRLTGVVFTVLFRPMQQTINLYPDVNTPGGYDIAFEYQTRYWLQPAPGVGDTPTAEAATLGTDVIMLDPLLMARKLKLDFLKAKGFDTTAAQRDYDLTYDEVAGNDSDSPVLTAHNRTQIDPLLGGQSIPFTGFGS